MLARQRAFVADASNELRPTLAVLQGELELAARPGRDRQELAAAVGDASAEARRLAGSPATSSCWPRTRRRPTAR